MTSEDFLAVDDGNTDEEFQYRVEEFRKSPKSVYNVNFRPVYEDNYPAKFDPELARMLIQLYSDEGDTVLDPMNGSGTIPLTAVELNRNAIGIDINQKALDVASKKYALISERMQKHGYLLLRHHDSRKPFFDIVAKQVGLVLTSPPFGIKAIVGTKKQYSNETADITNAPDYPRWREGLKSIMKNCYDVLMPGRLMIVEIRPRSVDGHDQPMDLWIQNDAMELGFERWGKIIETVDPWRMYTVKDKDNGFTKPYPGHAELLMMKKPMSSVNTKLM